MHAEKLNKAFQGYKKEVIILNKHVESQIILNSYNFTKKKNSHKSLKIKE